MGGARRFVDELDAYLAEKERSVTVLGRDARLTLAHLVGRERHADQSGCRIAANNVSFARGHTKKVLLRNALHFLSDAERRSLGSAVASRRLRSEAMLVRAMASRADRIIVPSLSMADRVSAKCPALASRIEVKPHPVSLAPKLPREIIGPPRILLPVLYADFKRLNKTLPVVAAAIDRIEADSHPGLSFRVTLSADEAALCGIGQFRTVVALGRLSTQQVSNEWGRSSVIVYPTSIESFGYPLAEANLRRLPVLARGDDWVREIAEDALVPLDLASSATVERSIRTALGYQPPARDVSIFNRANYFDTLFDPGR